MKKNFKRIAAAVLLIALLVSLASVLAAAERGGGDPKAAEELLVAKRRRATPTPSPRENGSGESPAVTPVPDGPIIEPQAITDWLFAHDFTLPDNFITKREAQDLGWKTRYRYVSDAAPGKSIGGDYFGNYEGLLPTARGRKYYECDCWYTGGPRNEYRIIFSNDGLVFYTEDHYQTFVQMFPSVPAEASP